MYTKNLSDSSRVPLSVTVTGGRCVFETHPVDFPVVKVT